MPTIINIDGFSVMILTNDHRPPHVHVFRGGGWVRITIGDETDRPRITEAIRLTSREMGKALDIVIAHQAKLATAWRKIHG